MSNDQSSQREIHWQTLKSIGWKLVIVAVALTAYAGQRALERTKQVYDGERSRPLVIVDDTDPKLADAPQTSQREDFIPLPVSLIRKPLVAAEQRTNGANALGQTRLSDFVNRIKYQNLKDEKEIIDRLNAEVLVESDLTKRAYLDTRDTLNKNRAMKLTLLADEKTQVYNRLTQVVSEKATEMNEPGKTSEVNATITELRQANPADDRRVAELKQTGGAAARKNRRSTAQSQSPTATLGMDKVLATASKEELAVWLNTLDKQISDEQNVEVARQWIADADRMAQSQIKTIYEALRPELSGIVREAKSKQGITAPSSPVSAFFEPRSIFNEKSGSYVIYQTIWLMCIGIMVFFVIFLFFALLRPLPFFAGRSETLGEHLERLLSRSGAAEGAAPQLARSLVVSAAALGVGTAAAVAVAGDRAINRPQPGNASAAVASAYEPGDGEPYPPGNRWTVNHPRTPLKVELTPQIIYPQPTIVEHTTYAPTGAPPFDPSLIISLNDRVTALTAANTQLTGTIDNLKTEVGTIGEVRNNVVVLRKQVGEVQVPALESRVGLVEKSAEYNGSHITKLERRMEGVETQFAAGLKDIAADLTVTKQAVSDLRYNSFERTQNSGGRNFFTRARQQLFRGEQFMITHQSFKALEDLLCRGGCGGDTNKTAIVAALQKLTGQPPVAKNKFMEKFAAVNPDALKQWQPLLLKYARVSY